MTIYKRSINKTMTKGLILFIILLCLLVFIQSYILISKVLYSSYEAHMKDVLTHISSFIDKDDLSDCVKSKFRSEKYKKLQAFMNQSVDDFNVENLYIVIPVPEKKEMINVVSAVSKEERAKGEKELVLLQISDAYDAEVLEHYKDAMFRADTAFFEEDSEYGSFYTGCMPLVTSTGDRVALLCADVPAGELHSTLYKYVGIGIAVTIGVGLLFLLLVIYWMKKNITAPVLELEKGPRSFAEQSQQGVDPRDLQFDVQPIKTDNEVESLYVAIKQMVQDIKQYVEDIITATQRAKHAEKAAIGMTKLAYQDQLTHVKSPVAFDNKLDELEDEVAAGTARFAVVMMDLNGLSEINTQYGQEHGDQYLVGGCKIFSLVYRHSPVYRIGEDEFIAILTDSDYESRQALFEKVCEDFRASSSNADADPWERYDAALGMAEYTSEDKMAEYVFARAEQAMYASKTEMKIQEMKEMK